MLDRCRRADSFFRPRSPTASRPISLREIFSAADGSEGVSDLPNMGMADAPHEPALVLYLPDKPLRGLVADASLDASPQARRRPRRTRRTPPPHAPHAAAARAARAAPRHKRRTRRTHRTPPLTRRKRTAAVPLSAPTLSLPAAPRRSGTPSPSCCTACSCSSRRSGAARRVRCEAWAHCTRVWSAIRSNLSSVDIDIPGRIRSW
mgnify:CR=1 FL=1